MNINGKPKAPKLTAAAKAKAATMSKKNSSAPQGGPVGKPAPKYDSNGKRILTGTGSVIKNQRMPELKRPGGISGASAKPKATPKATPKPSVPSMVGSAKLKSKYTQLPRKTR